jgi:hypothetical protein
LEIPPPVPSWTFLPPVIVRVETVAETAEATVRVVPAWFPFNVGVGDRFVEIPMRVRFLSRV